MESQDRARGVWERLIGLFLENRIIVAILVLLLVGAGMALHPFDDLAHEVRERVPFGLGDIPRDRVAVDAIPDIGENQQIVFTTWPGRSPRDIEDQVTYPLTTQLLGLPGVRTVRSSSMFGFSSIYVIFEDGVDFYWSRTRILEKLAAMPEGQLPPGASPVLGPDATALGQVYWYTLEGRDPKTGEVLGGWDQHELRTIQDWTVRYALQASPGVSEVASIGGYQVEYQVDVNPQQLEAYAISLTALADAVRASNEDIGARTIELNRVEYVVRGVGALEELEDLEEIVVARRGGRPIRVKDVARVGLGPANRRGALDVAGAPAVGGVVTARYGANPVEVIESLRETIAKTSQSLPSRTLADGRTSKVTIVPFYDRSEVVTETLDTLNEALAQQLLITILVVLVLLGNLRSSLVISATLPLSVLGAFILMKMFGVTANVMSLAGIAIAIGTMVDMGIVLTESMYAKQEEAAEGGWVIDRITALREGAAEVAPAVATSVATTVLSFLPVFGLTAAEGKLFHPLAYTKTFALIVALAMAALVLPTVAYLVLWPTERGARGEFWRAHGARARDLVLVVIGVSLVIAGSWWLGALVILVGCASAMRARLPPMIASRAHWAENIVAASGVTWLLTRAWMPLGEGVPMRDNVVFVGGLTFGLLLLLWVFLQVYEQLLRWTLSHKALFLVAPAALVAFGASAWLGFDAVSGWAPESVRESEAARSLSRSFPGFGEEFMPAFDEGQFLYMPTVMPHASFGQAQEQLRLMDAAIAQIPEVEEVVGKLGRVDSALDPAPVSMYETVVTYRDEYETSADGTRRRVWRDHIRSKDDIWQEIVKAAEQPGLTSAPMLMPINTRIVMLQSGMRASMGLKLQGPDLESLSRAGLMIEALLVEHAPGIRPETVFAERVVGKPYLEVRLDREAIARHGLSISDVQSTLQIALGGESLTMLRDGRERYPVRVRYARDERSSVEALSRVQVPVEGGESVPLEELVALEYVKGPQVIKSEDTFLTSYLIFDRAPGVAEVDAIERVDAFLARKRDSGELVLPDGVSYRFEGSYKNQLRSAERLQILIPLALLLIFLVLYVQFRDSTTSVIIYSGVVVAVSGGFILMWFYQQPWFMDAEVYGQNLRTLFHIQPFDLSVAVWVGVIALVGIATDDGVVMATYLKQRFDTHTPSSVEEIRALVLEAGKQRVRPCLMTTATTTLALLPVITSTGRGADIMLPMAIPSIGGMAIELITLFIVPTLYCAREEARLHFIPATSHKKSAAPSSTDSPS